MPYPFSHVDVNMAVCNLCSSESEFVSSGKSEESFYEEEIHFVHTGGDASRFGIRNKKQRMIGKTNLIPIKVL